MNTAIRLLTILTITGLVFRMPEPFVTVADLGALGGADSWSWAHDINESGAVVGGSELGPHEEPPPPPPSQPCLPPCTSAGQRQIGTGSTTNPTHAFLWTANHSMRDLGTLGGLNSFAYAVNDPGQVVGSSEIDLLNPGSAHAFLWSPDQGMCDLGTLGGHRSTAFDVNNLGQVVGSSTIDTVADETHAFLWTEPDGMIDLGGLGGHLSEAIAINSTGQIVGISATATGSQHAFLWTREDGMRDLGTLGGSQSLALGINDSGHVVGWSETTVVSGGIHPFLWTPESGMRDLGGLGGSGDQGVAFGNNNRDQVVGWTLVGDPPEARAFLWTEEAGMRDLGTLGGNYTVAFSINLASQAAGICRKASGQERACLWTIQPIRARFPLVPIHARSR